MTNQHGHFDFISLLKNGGTKAFEIIYRHFADRLYDYVHKRIGIKEVSEEIVQEIFVSLWSNRETVTINTSLDAYLFGAAKFKILSYMRSQRVRKAYAENFALFRKEYLDNSNEELIELKDLQRTIDSIISQLPDKCRTAFRLSRMEDEPIPRIAERMNISTRTVENYLTQAMRHLRTSLDELLAVLILWLIG